MSGKDFLDLLGLDDLTGDHRELAEIIGLEAFKALVKNYSGTYIYIPKAEGITKPLRNKLIREEFDGGNYNELARKYGLTVITVRDIVSNGRRAHLDGQLKIEV